MTAFIRDPFPLDNTYVNKQTVTNVSHSNRELWLIKCRDDVYIHMKMSTLSKLATRISALDSNFAQKNAVILCAGIAVCILYAFPAPNNDEIMT